MNLSKARTLLDDIPDRSDAQLCEALEASAAENARLAIRLKNGKLLPAETNQLPAPPRLFLNREAAERAIENMRRELIRYGYSPQHLDGAIVVSYLPPRGREPL